MISLSEYGWADLLLAGNPFGSGGVRSKEMLRLKVIIVGILTCVVMLVGSSLALAQDESGTVKGNNQGPEVKAETVEPAAQPNTLPFTGADVTLFVAIGLAAIGTGTLIVRRTRSTEAQ
jgi:LPXTG-motif cell wall-anchored protein